MGGTIQLKSEKNVGSTFTLILPFTIDEHQPSASEETATDTPADFSDLHILVVEDNELNLEIAVFWKPQDLMYPQLSTDWKPSGFLKNQNHMNTTSFLWIL